MQTVFENRAGAVAAQRISGPYEGYYVASYAVPFGQGHVAFAKICQEQPNDVWNCMHVDRVAGSPATSPAAALDAVWLMACRVIDRMPPPEVAVQDGADFFDAHTNRQLARIEEPFLKCANRAGDQWFSLEAAKEARQEFLKRFPTYRFEELAR